MNADIRKKWTDALRSGTYSQGNGRLTTIFKPEDIRHCCLGVLCQLAIQEGVEVPVKEYEAASGGFKFRSYGKHLDASFLPDEVAHWAGMHDNPGLLKTNQTVSLSDMNDRGASFVTIADFIDKESDNL